MHIGILLAIIFGGIITVLLVGIITYSLVLRLRSGIRRRLNREEANNRTQNKDNAFDGLDLAIERAQTTSRELLAEILANNISVKQEESLMKQDDGLDYGFTMHVVMDILNKTLIEIANLTREYMEIRRLKENYGESKAPVRLSYDIQAHYVGLTMLADLLKVERLPALLVADFDEALRRLEYERANSNPYRNPTITNPAAQVTVESEIHALMLPLAKCGKRITDVTFAQLVVFLKEEWYKHNKKPGVNPSWKSELAQELKLAMLKLRRLEMALRFPDKKNSEDVAHAAYQRTAEAVGITYNNTYNDPFEGVLYATAEAIGFENETYELLRLGNDFNSGAKKHHWTPREEKEVENFVQEMIRRSRSTMNAWASCKRNLSIHISTPTGSNKLLTAGSGSNQGSLPGSIKCSLAIPSLDMMENMEGAETLEVTDWDIAQVDSHMAMDPEIVHRVEANECTRATANSIRMSSRKPSAIMTNASGTSSERPHVGTTKRQLSGRPTAGSDALNGSSIGMRPTAAEAMTATQDLNLHLLEQAAEWQKRAESYGTFTNEQASGARLSAAESAFSEESVEARFSAAMSSRGSAEANCAEEAAPPVPPPLQRAILIKPKSKTGAVVCATGVGASASGGADGANTKSPGGEVLEVGTDGKVGKQGDHKGGNYNVALMNPQLLRCTFHEEVDVTSYIHVKNKSMFWNLEALRSKITFADREELMRVKQDMYRAHEMERIARAQGDFRQGKYFHEKIEELRQEGERALNEERMQLLEKAREKAAQNNQLAEFNAAVNQTPMFAGLQGTAVASDLVASNKRMQSMGGNEVSALASVARTQPAPGMVQPAKKERQAGQQPGGGAQTPPQARPGYPAAAPHAATKAQGPPQKK